MDFYAREAVEGRGVGGKYLCTVAKVTFQLMVRTKTTLRPAIHSVHARLSSVSQSVCSLAFVTLNGSCSPKRRF